MKIGTRSVLFGAHCFFLHPWFVAAAWWKLFGFPWDPRLWVAFIVHDLGYLGKPNMDGEEGERHVELGGWIMHRLFDHPLGDCRDSVDTSCHDLGGGCWRWYEFSVYHSRFYAKRYGRPFSRLCVADKLSIVLTPAWLYLPMVRWTGEIHEYMALAKTRTAMGEPKYASMQLTTGDQARWYADVQEYLQRWVSEHKDGRNDTWTPNQKSARTESGVWK